MKDWLAYEVLKNNSHVQDHVAVEIPVQLLLNKEKLTISMCSPSKVESWALGLLFTEGYITNRDDIIAVQVSSNKTTLEVAVETKSIQKRSNSMSLLSVTACGICGKTSLMLLMERF